MQWSWPSLHSLSALVLFFLLIFSLWPVCWTMRAVCQYTSTCENISIIPHRSCIFVEAPNYTQYHKLMTTTLQLLVVCNRADSCHTGDKLPIMRNAVSVESNTNAIRLQWPVLNRLLGSADRNKHSHQYQQSLPKHTLINISNHSQNTADLHNHWYATNKVND